MVEVEGLSEELWRRARPLLRDFDGAATELFVLGLTADAWPKLLGIVEQSFPKLWAWILDGETLEEAVAIDGGDGVRERVATLPSPLHALKADWKHPNEVQLYAWADAHLETVDLELVFWNDLSFPNSDPEIEHQRVFASLLELGRRLLEAGEGQKLILSPEHNGDPQELLKSTRVLVIEPAPEESSTSVEQP